MIDIDSKLVDGFWNWDVENLSREDQKHIREQAEAKGFKWYYDPFAEHDDGTPCCVLVVESQS